MELNIVPGVQRRRNCDLPHHCTAFRRIRIPSNEAELGALGCGNCLFKQLNSGWCSGIHEDEQWLRSPMKNREGRKKRLYLPTYLLTGWFVEYRTTLEEDGIIGSLCNFEICLKLAYTTHNQLRCDVLYLSSKQFVQFIAEVWGLTLRLVGIDINQNFEVLFLHMWLFTLLVYSFIMPVWRVLSETTKGPELSIVPLLGGGKRRKTPGDKRWKRKQLHWNQIQYRRA